MQFVHLHNCFTMAGGEQIYLLEKTPEQEQAEITAAATKLVDEGFRAELFNRDRAIDLGYQPKHFLKQINAVTACYKNDTIEAALGFGVKENFFSTVNRCDLKQFLAFSKYLQSKQGQAALHHAQKTNKLKKRRFGNFDVKDIAYETIFNAQRADYLYVVKKEREMYGAKIDELRRQVKQLERMRDKRIEEVSAFYKPASDYIEPEPEEIAAAVSKAYAVEHFGGIVKK